MTANLATAKYTATGGTTGATIGDRSYGSWLYGSSVINVKDFGARGDGTNPPETATLQACIDLAFSGGLAHPELNKILYFPAGQYLIDGPLYVANVNGGVILGAGTGAVDIVNNVNPPAGNSVTGDSKSPIFVMENVSNMRIETLDMRGNFAVGTQTLSPDVVGIYFFCSGGGTCDNNFLVNLSLSDLGVAVMLGGTGSDQIVRGTLMFQCHILRCNVNAVRAESAASTGCIILGEGAADCGQGHNVTTYGSILSTYVPGSTLGNGGGAYAAINGQINVLTNLSSDSNVFCTANGGNYPMVITSVRDEPFGFAQSSVVCAGSGPVMLAGYIVGGLTRVANYTPVPVTPPNAPFNVADCFNGGRIHIIAPSIAFTTTLPLGNNGPGNIAKLGSTGSVILDEVTYGSTPYSSSLLQDIGFEGSAGSVAVQRNIDSAYTMCVDASGATIRAMWVPTLGYTGSITTVTFPTPYTSATGGLPPPSTAYKGARFTLTDSTSAYSAANFNTAISVGGGANVIPVWCDGTNWRMG